MAPDFAARAKTSTNRDAVAHEFVWIAIFRQPPLLRAALVRTHTLARGKHAQQKAGVRF
jgi:hypothetical protein